MDMNSLKQSSAPDSADALIDEVRGIRREICQQFDNDVTRLLGHLREVERDFAARRGAFAGVSKAAAANVVDSWGQEVLRADDPIVDEVRAIRKGLAERQP
jgi:hypothetical protein